MSTDPVSVLMAIVEEVAGAGQPFSDDSYLPAHLIHDARQAIEEAQADVPASALEAHEKILLARLAKADEVIASLRAEIDSMRRPKIPCQPPDALLSQWKAAHSPDDATRLMHITVYARQECDA